MEDQANGENMLNQENIKAEFTASSQLQAKDIDEVMEFLRIGYGERWQGEENYRNAIVSNSTELLRIYVGEDLGASLYIDNDRITAIAVHPDMRGQGLGVRLFEEAAKAHPNVWISAGTDAEEMMTTLTSSKLNFLPVEDKEQIEELYKRTNQARDNKYHVEAETLEVPFLAERLKKKGINQHRFTAYSRPGGTHKGSYKQVLFQNRAQGVPPA